MISKKDALTLGILAVGGIAAASAVAGSGDTGKGGLTQRKAGGILGTYGGEAQSGGFEGIKLPQEPTVIFSGGKDYSGLLESFIGAEEAPVSRGVQGVSSAGKKLPVTPYIYTGGEVKSGAVSVAPWAMGRTTPAEIGVTTALSIARGGGGGAPSKKAAPKKKYVRRSEKGYTYKGGKLSKKKDV